MITFDLARVTDVRHARGHTLWLRFSDGLEGEVDLSARIRAERGVLAELRDESLFARVRVEADSVAWPNGADWAPETLYALVSAAKGLRGHAGDDGARPDAVHPAPVLEISRFFGIVISMYFVDHVRPHFHARFGEHSIAVEIDGDGISGSFRPHRLPLVYEWRDAHRHELRENWNRSRERLPLLRISPLA
jgi:hypothetical protein